jgi:NitT/TauT family transport system ATP-binding protein
MVRSQPEDIRSMLAHHRWDEAIALLQRLNPIIAADVFQTLPEAEQETLYKRLPLDLTATLTGALPAYDAYILLVSRPPGDISPILDRMAPGERMQFIEEIPEEAWQHINHLISLSGGAQPAEEKAGPAPKREAIIEARNVEKWFGKPDGGRVQVIAATSLAVEPGDIIALLGPSGSGKSTLLRMLSGLSQPSAGEVLWHGRPVSESRPNVAIVFQSFALFPWLTVLENVEVPLLARGVDHMARHHRALKALGPVGLKGFENAYPKELSGGMKQRVGFARALAVEPEVLFMDEPFSALDVLTAENLRSELLDLWVDKKIPTKSIFLVTHNIEEAVQLADRIIVLGRNPARIRADFRVPTAHPRDRASHEFTLYVDYIYKLMTQPQLVAAPPETAGAARAKPAPQVLPHARLGAVAGFLELLYDRGAKEDLYRIAEELRMEVDDLLPIVEAASLLELALADKGDVELTPLGRRYVEADMEPRRQIIREAVLKDIQLVQQMNNALAGKSNRKMPLEFFRDILDESFSDADTARQIETALSWGRFAGILDYDAESDTISLPEPATASETVESVQLH